MIYREVSLSMPETTNTETIFREYKDRVYRLALSISRNQSDAEDIMQNAFLKIISNLGKFRRESSLSTWIYKITYNESLMYLRKKRSQLRLTSYLGRFKGKDSSGIFINWSKLPDRQLLDSELKAKIDEAIRYMPIKYRMPLLLEYVEGLPIKDSADILGLKINSFKTRLHRAHLVIKSELSEYFRDRQREKEKEERKCHIWIEFVYSYLKGSLAPKKSKAFKAHIKDCANCNLFLDNYLRAISITHALECRDLPAELKDKIQTFLFKKKSKNIETIPPLKHLN